MKGVLLIVTVFARHTLLVMNEPHTTKQPAPSVLITMSQIIFCLNNLYMTVHNFTATLADYGVYMVVQK